MSSDIHSTRSRALFPELQSKDNATKYDLFAPESASRFEVRAYLADREADRDIEVLPTSHFPAEVDLLGAREQELMEILGCGSKEQIVHCVRNLQNNVVLLKALLAKKDRKLG